MPERPNRPDLLPMAVAPPSPCRLRCRAITVFITKPRLPSITERLKRRAGKRRDEWRQEVAAIFEENE